MPRRTTRKTKTVKDDAFVLDNVPPKIVADLFKAVIDNAHKFHSPITFTITPPTKKAGRSR